jgi:hypothetical protein
MTGSSLDFQLSLHCMDIVTQTHTRIFEGNYLIVVSEMNGFHTMLRRLFRKPLNCTYMH